MLPVKNHGFTLSLLSLVAATVLTLLQLVAPVATAGSNSDTSFPPENELHIARLIYQHHENSNWGPGRPWWAIDWPDAEFHFTNGIKRLTNIDVAPDSRHISLDDDAIFDYPWLLVQQVGRWSLSRSERLQLKEYLDRGGFMVVDDFHGPAQMQVFRGVMTKVLGGVEIVPIGSTEELLHVLYDLDQRTQIPGRRHLRQSANGIVARMPDTPPRWLGIYDDQQRLMVAINFNMDMGDAWEHADDPIYPVSMTSLAYRFGINYLIYAMTH